MKTFTIARFTLLEAFTRRLILAGLLLSVGFLALFALGYSLLWGNVSAASAAHVQSPNNTQALALTSALLTIMGLYCVNFLAAFFALFLSVGAISGEVDAGTLHALLARPLRRTELVLGRWLAYTTMTGVYVAGMVSALLLIARSISGFESPDPVRAALLMMLQAVLLLSLSLLGSTLMPTLANGVVVFSLFGLAWLGGILEVIGGVIQNVGLLNVGTAVSLLLPSDALWRGASYYLQPPLMLAATSNVGATIPFIGTAPPTQALLTWALLYPALMVAGAVLRFRRRDL